MHIALFPDYQGRELESDCATLAHERAGQQPVMVLVSATAVLAAAARGCVAVVMLLLFFSVTQPDLQLPV